MDSTSPDLLQLYDELTALHAASAFVTQALAAALIDGGGLDDRSATGAVFCAQWLNERSAALDGQLKALVSESAIVATNTGIGRRDAGD